MKCGICKSKAFKSKCEVCRFNRNLDVTKALLKELKVAAEHWARARKAQAASL